MEPRELTPTELGVLRSFAFGNSSREIAASFNIHQSAVLSHLRVATRKLGASNAVHAAVIATEIGLIRTGVRAGKPQTPPTPGGVPNRNRLTPPPGNPADAQLAARLRERAYFIWLDEGKPHGRDKENWEQAEEELEAEAADEGPTVLPEGPPFGSINE